VLLPLLLRQASSALLLRSACTRALFLRGNDTLPSQHLCATMAARVKMLCCKCMRALRLRVVVWQDAA
jgi:hypothetical protein